MALNTHLFLAGVSCRSFFLGRTLGTDPEGVVDRRLQSSSKLQVGTPKGGHT